MAGQQVHTITGTVVNAVTGEPVRRALVQMQMPRNATALTGPDGRFQFAEVPEGPVLLNPQKPGYFIMQRDLGGGVVQVTAGKNDFQIKLSPAAGIVGQITDRDGEPVENTQIQVLAEITAGGHKQLQSRSFANSDDDGAYRFDELMPGRYVVFATGHALPPQNFKARREVSVPAYYPNADNLASAQVIELGAGQEFHADFRLRAQPGFRIAGKVLGAPANGGVSFSLENGDGLSVGNTLEWKFDQPTGDLSVEPVPKGIWKLVLTSSDSAGQQTAFLQELAIEGTDIDNLQMPLQPLATIPVTVNHTTQPETPPDGTLARMGSTVNPMLVSTDSISGRQVGAQQDSEDAGNLTFKNVPAGKYRLNVQVMNNECVESAWYGNVDLLRDYLIVGAEGSGQGITLNLRSDCASLSGKLRAEDKSGGGILLALPTSSPMADAVQIPVFGQGPWVDSRINVLNKLSPGTYQVFAFSSIEGLEYENPEALRQYPSQTVTLSPGQKLELTVELSKPNEN